VLEKEKNKRAICPFYLEKTEVKKYFLNCFWYIHLGCRVVNLKEGQQQYTLDLCTLEVIVRKIKPTPIFKHRRFFERFWNFSEIF